MTKEKQTPIPLRHEHERDVTLVVREYYENHEPRTESPTFAATKRAGHKAGLRCAFTGQKTGVEYHHFYCEWAQAFGVDWAAVKAIALGQVTELPVLDPKTMRPDGSGETFPAEGSYIKRLCEQIAAAGFDWESFDPAVPETLIDGMPNMLVIHEQVHRAANHGVHMVPLPEWQFQCFPKKAGFIESPDEVPTQKKG
ncbi:hypothetical protein [Trinickia mobilis]|uniref:hypothetical protein n=1 Tax=Trinickia mobilis TaxID=2816356 RepID=UPI001F5CC299|nr:hypothetical protein [Trinickia mobilis]